MFLFKKIIAPLFLPLAFSVLLLIFSLIYLQFRQTQRRGKYYVFFAILLLLLAGQNYLSDRFLETLEHRYSPINLSQIKAQDASIKWIVVLGGGTIPNARLSAVEQLSDASVHRLWEGLRLHRRYPGSRLLLSGGMVDGDTAEAQLLAKAAEAFGARTKDIVMDLRSRDTEEQACRIRALIGKERLILVTSAFHMPRAVGLFRHAGLDPIPAPARFLIPSRAGAMRLEDFYVSAEGLRTSELAVHEYLGILWAKIRGKI